MTKYDMIERWTAECKTALMVEIVLGKRTVKETFEPITLRRPALNT